MVVDIKKEKYLEDLFKKYLLIQIYWKLEKTCKKTNDD